MHPTRSIFRASPSQSLLSHGGKRCLFKTPTGPAIPGHYHAPCATTKMHHHSFPGLFARGGTSNGLIIKRDDLPPQDLWYKVLPAAMGSPDPYGRQLNGMGTLTTCFAQGTWEYVDAHIHPSCYNVRGPTREEVCTDSIRLL